MNLPTLPTDSLYKFFLIGGIALFISCLFSFKNEMKENHQQLISSTKSWDSAVARHLSYRMDTLQIGDQISFLRNKMKDLDDKPGRGKVKDPYLIRKQAIEDSIFYLSSKMKSLNFYIENKKPEFDLTELIVLNNKHAYADARLIYAIMVSVSLMCISIGFYGWVNHQVTVDKIQKTELAKSQWQEQPCQSCGTLLKYDLKAKEGDKYCTICIDGEKFREPDLTLLQLSARIREKMKRDLFPEKGIQKQLKLLRTLDRWKRSFRW